MLSGQTKGMHSMTRNELVSNIIEMAIRALFKKKAIDAYEGRLTTLHVLIVVCQIVREYGFEFTESVQGETFDQIRELGPCGEDDVKWLEQWSNTKGAKTA